MRSFRQFSIKVLIPVRQNHGDERKENRSFANSCRLLSLYYDRLSQKALDLPEALGPKSIVRALRWIHFVFAVFKQLFEMTLGGLRGFQAFGNILTDFGRTSEILSLTSF